MSCFAVHKQYMCGYLKMHCHNYVVSCVCRKVEHKIAKSALPSKDLQNFVGMRTKKRSLDDTYTYWRKNPDTISFSAA